MFWLFSNVNKAFMRDDAKGLFEDTVYVPIRERLLGF